MQLLTLEQAATLHDWLLPERPGPLVGQHVLQTGHGTWYADRWPRPRAALAAVGGNCTLLGDAAALPADALRQQLYGFVDAPAAFLPLLRAACPTLAVWDRVILELAAPAPMLAAPAGATVRPLVAADAGQVAALSDEVAWIAKTWGGPAGLAASGHAYGAFVGGRLVAVACSFFVGEHHEDLGVVTEPEHRGVGLSAACAAALCRDIQRRGRRPSWSTSPDNTASLRVAEKLSFTHHRRDCLYVVGVPIPPPAVRPGS